MEENPPVNGVPDPGPSQPPSSDDRGKQVGKKLWGPLAVLAAFFAKIKAFLLPALKFLPILKTTGTMLISIAVYAYGWGWRFAVGFVLLIFVHECGHLLVARKLGLKVGAPMFIPFVGALIALKEMPRNAWMEALVGIGGPILGAAGAAVCFGIYAATGNGLFAVLAYTGFFINLFNLAPIGFLDGGRIVTALSPWLWLAGTVVIGLMMFYHFNPLLLFIFVFSLPRLFSLFRKKTEQELRYFEVTPQQRWIMGSLYFGLMLMLVLGMVATKMQTRANQHRGETISLSAPPDPDFNAGQQDGRPESGGPGPARHPHLDKHSPAQSRQENPPSPSSYKVEYAAR